MLKYNDIDPFDEEDWDEGERNIIVFKVRITAITKQISIVSFPALLILHGNTIHVYDNSYHRLYMSKESTFGDKIRKGLMIDSYYIVDKNYMSYSNIVSNLNRYLNNRLRSAMHDIVDYKEALDDYYYDGDYDEDELNDMIERNELLVRNIRAFLDNKMVEKTVKDMI